MPRLRLLDCLLGFQNKLLEVLVVVKIREGKAFVRQQHGGSTVDYVVNNNLAISQSIAERFYLVGNPQREVMIGQRDADARESLKECQEFCNIEACANIEVWFVITTEKLKQLATGPVCYIKILCNDGIVTDRTANLRRPSATLI